MMRQFNAGVIQFDVQKGDIQKNFETIEHQIKILSKDNVKLAVLPEMFTCSFDNQNLKDHAQQTDQILSRLSALAKKEQIAISGSLPVQKDKQIFNTMVFIDTDGDQKGSYEKLHLFRLTKEDEFYAAGSAVGVADTSLGKIGMMICYDLRFPELARSMVLEDIQLLLVSAQWPAARVHHWQTLLTARAIENQLYVIGTNRIGSEDELVFSGASMIVDPWGRTIVQGDSDQIAFWGEINMEKIGEARATIPCMTDRRDDIYG